MLRTYLLCKMLAWKFAFDWSLATPSISNHYKYFYGVSRAQHFKSTTLERTLGYIIRAGNRAAPDIQFVNKYPPSRMKKVGFSQFSWILLMLPLKFTVMNTLHSFLDPTVYLLCRKVCEYKNYTGMKNRSERKFPCRVQSKMPFFAIWLWKLAYYQEIQLALVIKFIKTSYN